MPVYRARRLCPDLTLLPPDPELLAKGTRSLLEVSSAYSPVTEPSAGGRLFLDLTGCRRLLGGGRDSAARLEKEIAARLRLQGAVGVAGNKLVSRIASGCLEKPGVCDVLRGAERTFIAPLPVSVLPGIGAARESVLMRDLNLRRVEEVADLSVAQLRLAFGPFAPLLHQRSCGIDPSPVQPPRRTPEVAEEAFPEAEENDDRILLAELCRLAEGCGLRLRRLGKETGRLVLTLTYADGVIEQGTAALPSPLCHDLPLLAAVEELFHRTCKRRVRLKGMRLVCGRLASGNRQMDLFSPDGEPAAHQAALQEALDRLRGAYGMAAVRWGRSFA
jgi:DNA polymerase-4